MDQDETVNLRVLYFEKVSNEVKATLEGITSRIIKTVKVMNNTLVFDLNDNGSVVYTFEVARKEGKVTVVSSKFYKINNPNYKADIVQIDKTSNFLSVKNKTFKNAENSIIKFNADTWLWSAYPNVTVLFTKPGMDAGKV